MDQDVVAAEHGEELGRLVEPPWRGPAESLVSRCPHGGRGGGVHRRPTVRPSRAVLAPGRPHLRTHRSSEASSSTRSSLMSDPTSRRSARPKRRRRNSISMATNRSSASSSSRARSAFLVTLKAWCSPTTMPGKRVSRWAAMTCSSGTKRSPSGMTTKRGSTGAPRPERRDAHRSKDLGPRSPS